MSIERLEHEGDGQHAGEGVDDEEILTTFGLDDREVVVVDAHGDAEVVDGQAEAEQYEGDHGQAEGQIAETVAGVERCTEVEGGHGCQVEEAQATTLAAAGLVDPYEGSVSGDRCLGEQEVGSQVRQGSKTENGDADVRHDAGQCAGENVRQELFAGGHGTSRFL